MSYQLHFGKNEKGEAIRSKNGKKSWMLMKGVKPEKVKACLMQEWQYGGKYKGKTIKEIMADDAEYLEWIEAMLDKDAPQMDCLRLLLK